MKWLNYFFLIFVFCFFIACDSIDGVKRVVPENEDNKEAETDEDSEEDDSDLSDSDDSSDPTDSGDLTDSGDNTDTDSDTTDGDAMDNSATDNDITDNGTVDNDTVDNDTADNDTTDNDTTDSEPDYPEAKCKAAGGNWDSSAQKCYKTQKCGNKPANSEWNGDSSYKIYYDLNVEAWEPLTYPTQYGEGAPVPCQYKCIANYSYVNGECKPYCSAVFNGTDTVVEVAHNDLLNLTSETWTIETWIKQGEGDIPTYVVHPIVRKGITSNPVYVLSGYYKEKSGDGYGMTAYLKYSYKDGWNRTQTTENRIDQTVTYSNDWTHVAMVKNKETTSSGWVQTTTYKLLLFVNGTLVESKNFENTPTIITNNEALTIGANIANLDNDNKRYFKGLIDSVKISNTAKYTGEFVPEKLVSDGDTVAFWNFSGNAEDSSGNNLNGIEESLTYSTDCKQ